MSVAPEDITAVAEQMKRNEEARVKRERLATESLLAFVGEIFANLTENGSVSVDFDLNGLIKSLRVTTPEAHLFYAPPKITKPEQ